MKSNYKGVYEPNPRHYRKRKQYRARIRIDGDVYDEYYETKREAAIRIDKILIRHGKPPVNILKAQ